MTTQSQSLRLADLLVAQPYAWPGGYPRYAVMNDGVAICKNCASDNREAIGTTTGSDGWFVAGLEVNWEDSGLTCDHCGESIESAYGEGA